MFTGAGTALITPFRADLSVDEEALRAIVRRQMSEGIDFLVPCGTTGESPTLSAKEKVRVTEVVLEEAKGKVPVVAGAGGYNTAAVVELAKEYEALEVDGLLSVTPYYNKPTPDGLFAHYAAIAAATKLPIILYNVPPRTQCNITPEVLGRLATIDHVVGVKEASGSISQMVKIFEHVPETFAVLSGDDSVTLPLISLGGVGVISVASNQIPGRMAALCRAALAGDFAEARRIHRENLALMEVNFCESSPGPVKYAMSRLGLCEPVWRLPMVAPAAANQTKVEGVLRAAGLLADGE